jgi:hyperosmotically inducible periplasmic protein
MQRVLVRSLSTAAILAAIPIGCARAPAARQAERALGDALHDVSITTRIKTTYLFNPHLGAFPIHVDTRDGVVTLRGTVPSDVHRDLAGEIALNADWVRDVDNELSIAPNTGDGPDEPDRTFGEAVRDASITASVRLSLALEPGLKASRITIHTNRSTVTLSGEIESQAERSLASRVARDTEGVRHVVNQLQVRG